VVIGHIDTSTHTALVFCHCDIMMLGVLWLCCNISNELLTYKFVCAQQNFSSQGMLFVHLNKCHSTTNRTM